MTVEDALAWAAFWRECGEVAVLDAGRKQRAIEHGFTAELYYRTAVNITEDVARALGVADLAPVFRVR